MTKKEELAARGRKIFEQSLLNDEARRREMQNLTVPRKAFPVKSVRPRLFTSETSHPLPDDYKLTKLDVINGRGRKSYSHIGNRRFRQMAALNLKRYYEAKIKTDKSMIVAGLVSGMREGIPSGGFVKQDPKRKAEKGWITVGGRETREKVGHCLRDMIASVRQDPRRKEAFQILQAGKSCDPSQMKPKTTPSRMTLEQRAVLQLLESGYEGSTEGLYAKIRGDK